MLKMHYYDIPRSIKELERPYFDWIGHPDCLSKGREERFVIVNKDDVKVVASRSISIGSGFEEVVLIRINNVFFVLKTSEPRNSLWFSCGMLVSFAESVSLLWKMGLTLIDVQDQS